MTSAQQSDNVVSSVSRGEPGPAFLVKDGRASAGSEARNFKTAIAYT